MKAFDSTKPFTHVSVYLDVMMDVKECKVTQVEVLADNNNYIVLNDHYFTKLQKKADKSFNINHVPELVSIGEESSETMIKYFGKFRINLYSQLSIKRMESKINREFKKWLDKKTAVYGMAREINISLEVKG